MKRSPIKTSLSLVLLVSILLTPLLTPTQAVAAERSLLGIRIFSPISIVLSRYGNPTYVESGMTVLPVEFTTSKPTLLEGNSQAGTESLGNTDQAGAPAPDAATTSATFDPLYAHGSRYYYDLPKKGQIYEFVATSAGRVVEIKVYGYRGTAKTSLGIGLGSTYEQIVLKYGFPESTVNEFTSDGDVLTLNYPDRSHVSFRLIRNRLAAISVVAPD